jgi:fused signal recognition particle receptor
MNALVLALAMLALGTVEVVLLVLIAAVLVFGVGVLLVSRRRDRGDGGLPSASSTTLTRPPAGRGPTAPPEVDEGDTLVEEQELAEDERLEEIEEQLEGGEEPGAELVIERPRFRDRLAKARATLAGAVTGVRSRAGITDDTWDDLEEALLRADVGVRVTDELLGDLRSRFKAKEITEPEQLLTALQEDMKAKLEGSDRSLQLPPGPDGSPNVWLFVGVNGVGKTTTIGKVAALQAADGHKVLMAAGDTFRAAAAEQLHTWATRAGAEFVRGNEGGDPSAVIFDGVQAAAARGCDLVLGDTAGRLHNKSNLMEELRKVRRVADREPGRVSEVLLVIDATTGQNGLTQAREFGDATDVTGVVLTKLDGSAKGGIVFAIETELGIPVKLVGLGETIADLVPFDPDEFVDALFTEN